MKKRNRGAWLLAFFLALSILYLVFPAWLFGTQKTEIAKMASDFLAAEKQAFCYESAGELPPDLTLYVSQNGMRSALLEKTVRASYEAQKESGVHLQSVRIEVASESELHLTRSGVSAVCRTRVFAENSDGSVRENTVCETLLFKAENGVWRVIGFECAEYRPDLQMFI